MITVKYIPNILSEEGRSEFKFDFDSRNSIKNYIDLAKLKSEGCKVIVSGAKIDDLDRTIVNGDEIIVTPDVQLETIGAALYWLFWTHLGATLMVIGTVASIAMSMMMSQSARVPNFGTTGDGIDESSPTYGWDGMATQQDIGIPVPIVFGRHGVGGNRIVKL